METLSEVTMGTGARTVPATVYVLPPSFAFLSSKADFDPLVMHQNGANGNTAKDNGDGNGANGNTAKGANGSNFGAGNLLKSFPH